MQPSIFHGIEIVFRKELVTGMRFKAAWSVMLMFALTTLSCVSLALQGAALEPGLQAALLWTILFFSAMSGIDRIFADEDMRGTLPMLKIYGSSQPVLFGKMLYTLALLLFISVFVIFLFLILLDVSVTAPSAFAATAFLGILGLAAAGTFIAALTTGASVKSGLFSVLMLPVVLPIFLPAIFLTGESFGEGAASLSYLGGMAIYDLLLMVGASMLFDYLWYEE